MTAEELIAFESEIADTFNAGHIRAPIHLDGGNEDQLIEIFNDIAPTDWVCGSWRMHYKCLLHGVPPAELKAEIMAGRSIALCFPKHRVISSAIVGGILPIALGIAMQIKRSDGKEKVWCFIGDMTSETGAFHECAKYATGYRLPIHWVVEDNTKSVMTNTREVWRRESLEQESEFTRDLDTIYYHYRLPWPHSGAGKRIQF